jgi:hypothetical protein
MLENIIAIAVSLVLAAVMVNFISKYGRDIDESN